MIIKFQTAGDRNSFNSLEQAKQYPVGSKRQGQGDKFPEAESYRRERKSRTENIRSALLKSSDRIKGRKQFSECNSRSCDGNVRMKSVSYREAVQAENR
ncbi:hypothetical protein K310107B6_22640 [Mediterraneibacter gnavus]